MRICPGNVVFSLVACLLTVAAVNTGPGNRLAAEGIIAKSGIAGGLVVQVGCDSPESLVALRVNDSYLVHGLDVDEKKVDAARKHIRSKGLYGNVSVDTFGGKRLPYADNLLNLIVVPENKYEISNDEIMRVLAPLGVALVNGRMTVKPWPDDIDEWTHYMHGPDNNSSAKDSVVGFPRYLRWKAGPRWGRHHDTVQGVEAIVSARGRLFYILDEAEPIVGSAFPDRWVLVARDAFSGVLLWKRPCEDFGWTQWSKKNNIGRFNNPKQMHRRLVAVEDRVYVTLGFDAPVSVLDGGTGEVIKFCKGTDGTTEVLYYDTNLFLSVKEPVDGDAFHRVVAVNPVTGDRIWASGLYRGNSGIFARLRDLFLTAGSDKLFFLDQGSAVGLDVKTGKEAWRWEGKAIVPAKTKTNRLPEYSTLIHHEGVVYLLRQTKDAVKGKARTQRGKKGPPSSTVTILTAISADSGKELWSNKQGAFSFGTHSALFAAQDLIWCYGLEYATLVGLDPLTGAVKRTIDVHDAIDAPGGHIRCYPDKATEHGLWTTIGGKPQQVVNLDNGETSTMPWLRSACRIGMLPCNGLAYITPHPCICNIEIKLNGMLALASQQQERAKTEITRFIKGPAYARPSSSERASESDWPTFRHDFARSNCAKTTLPEKLKALWNKRVGKTLTQPVVVGKRLFVADRDSHSLYAMDVNTGEELWSYTCGGRLDTPPTIYEGKVLSGSADGWIYCLDVASGELRWRYRVAPEENLIVSHNRIESSWPVHGTIMVHDGKVIAAAGHSSYLDGGIHICVLDPATGKVLKQENRNTTGLKYPVRETGALSEILVSTGHSVRMRGTPIYGGGAKDARAVPALSSSDQLLYDSWYNRTGPAIGGVSGEAVATDGSQVYVFKALKTRSKADFFNPGQKEGTLSSRSISSSQAGWTVDMPLILKTMIVTADKIVVAGSPDVLDAQDPWGTFDGSKGGRLMILSKAAGRLLESVELPAMPAYEGLAAAGGRLFISLKDGTLICFDDTGDGPPASAAGFTFTRKRLGIARHPAIFAARESVVNFNGQQERCHNE